MTYAHTDKFYINGEWVEPLSSTAFDVVNPATEKTFATLSLGASTDVDRAVAAAKKAYKTWGAPPVKNGLLPWSVCLRSTSLVTKTLRWQF